MGISVEERLAEAGFRMLGEDRQIKSLIIDILKTKNPRYLKAIPFLIYKYRLNTGLIRKDLDLDEEREYGLIINYTARIFHDLNIKQEILTFNNEFKNEGREYGLNYEEFKGEFEMQLRNDSKPNLLIDSQKVDEERNLQFALSQLFTKKEREIIKKLQENKAVSKTEYEYYSRKTKKKIKSIITLHDFALGISQKSPTVENKTKSNSSLIL